MCLTTEEKYEMAALQRKTAEADKEDFKNMEEGEYDARLVYVADLGMQTREYKGETKSDCQQLSLGLEILGQVYTDDDGNEHPKILWTNPFNIFSSLTGKGKELTYYSNFMPKAKEGEVPDWEQQLGKPVSVSIVHKVGTGENVGNVYDNIGSLTTIPAKYQTDLASCVTVPCVGDSEDESNECTSNLGGLAKYVWEKRVSS